ncbi:hypothetical protein DFS34DRAFT_608844 [Phlyctochytrium arcticum]|nr:hypothetical protein DFS34DRAFT_608844 [Phlyctochytrium arcticum]
MIFSSSTGLSGTLTEQLRISSSGVYLTGSKLVASQEYVSTQIAAIPLSNYTLLSTYNTRQTVIDNRFTPIEARQITGILPVSKLNTSTLQPLIDSSNAASIKTILGLSSTASSGTIEYANILNKPSFGSLALKNTVDLSTSEVSGILPVNKVNTTTLQPLITSDISDEINLTLAIEWNTLAGRPTLGSLALKNTVDLSTSDVIGNLDFARISDTPSYVLNSNYNTRITPIETKLTGYDTSITSKLLTLNLGTGNQPLGITINAPSSALSGNGVLSMNNASSSTQWGLHHAGQNGDGQIAGSTATDSTSTTSGALTIAGGASIAKNLYVVNNLSTPILPVYRVQHLHYHH